MMIGSNLPVHVRLSALFMVVALLGIPPPAGAQTTALFLDSQSGDTVGRGLKRTYLPADGTFRATQISPSNIDITFTANTDRFLRWQVDFSVAREAPMAVGVYEPARGYSGSSVTLIHGLGIGGDGISCGAVVGRYEVLEIVRNSAGTLVQFAADFEQHCGDGDPGLFGAIRYNSTISTLTPFGGRYPNYALTIDRPIHGRIVAPGIDCGDTGGMQCSVVAGAPAALTLSAEPAPGYLFMGWSGDCVGTATSTIRINMVRRCGVLFDTATPAAPRSLFFLDRPTDDQVLTPANSFWSLSPGTPGTARLSVSSVAPLSSITWTLDFRAPDGARLEAGRHYAGARRSASGLIPGLAVFSNANAGCSEGPGVFDVLDVAYSPAGEIERLAVDFEESCGGTSSLFGVLRYNSSAPGTVAFGGPNPLYRLTLTPPEHGTISGTGINCGGTQTQCRADLAAPTEVALTARPDPGFVFAGWSGDCAGVAVIALAVSGRRECGAAFQPIAAAARTLFVWDNRLAQSTNNRVLVTLSDANSQWRVTPSTAGFVDFSIIYATPTGVASAAIQLRAPSGTALQAGMRYVTGSSSSTAASMSVHAGSSFCGPISPGEFIIHDMAVSNGTVVRFRADFSLECSGASIPAKPSVGSIYYNSTAALSTVGVDRSSFAFTATTRSGSPIVNSTPPQTLRIVQSGEASDWSVSADQPWVSLSAFAGHGPGTVTVGVRSTTGLPLSGTRTATITLVARGAANGVDAIPVSLALVPETMTTAPVGVIDTPLDNVAGVSGSLPITGWALDDIGITAVRIYRGPAAGEPASLVFLGNATPVEGARPDVAAAFPSMPLNTRAGWGYILLTNVLPNQGNGTFRVYAYADDAEGKTAFLGSKAFTADNAAAVKPFGTIDTPDQGSTVSGAVNNFGWVLSRAPRRADPPGGGDVSVWIDGVKVGVPGGWTARADLTSTFSPAQFPGINSAAGVFTFDSRALSDGVHTLGWLVYDNQGIGEGIGSRFFTVANGLSSTSAPPGAVVSSRTADRLPDDGLLVEGRRGDDGAAFTALASGAGLPTLHVEELDLLALRFAGAGTFTGYLRLNDGLGPLPAGSNLDPDTGLLTWQPGAGFLGRYDIVLIRAQNGVAVGRQYARIVIHPKGSGRPPR